MEVIIIDHQSCAEEATLPMPSSKGTVPSYKHPVQKHGTISEFPYSLAMLVPSVMGAKKSSCSEMLAMISGRNIVIKEKPNSLEYQKSSSLQPSSMMLLGGSHEVMKQSHNSFIVSFDVDGFVFLDHLAQKWLHEREPLALLINILIPCH